MKFSSAISLLLLFLLIVPLRAQVPDAAPAIAPTSAPTPAGSPSAPATDSPEALSQSIFLDVKDLGTNVSSSTNWQSAWGSFSKDYKKARGLELTLRNPAKIKGEYTVEWYFFAIPLRGGARYLYDKGSKPLSLPPGGMEKVTVLSAEISSNKTLYRGDYYYSSYSHKSGRKPEGWGVVVKIGDKIIRVKTPTAQMEEIFRKPEQLQAYIDKM